MISKLFYDYEMGTSKSFIENNNLFKISYKTVQKLQKTLQLLCWLLGVAVTGTTEVTLSD